ncbi:PAS domain S-box protein [Novosphingobium album (ex Liu et al. 2023)]|uniref:histidine kinase n=1 Tax=Novosphingobium album (ex Liu et al. 2023) TaxID=3031130 RepID=A0ABT5WV00_9SPHN|nr:PAS domain S-box protein [Novosphingobium album (ex Liu et al. 2023)]MDE8653678.1 PAS domain S-box protein [Novosphingobium album (ex Liu et al. 2023)]
MNGELGELLLEHVPVAVVLFDRDMRYLACSRRWLIDFGFEHRDIIGRPHREVFPEIDERLRGIHDRVLAGETLSNELEPFRHADGSVDWVQWKMVPWQRWPGEIGGTVLFTQVLNDLVRSRQWSRSLNTELDLLIDSAKRHAICLLDLGGRVVIWNAGAERLYGWQGAEVVGKPYDMMFGADDRDAGVPGLQLAEARREGTFQGRSWRQRKDGSRFHAEVTISRILDDAGAVIAFGQVVRDITEESARIRQIEENEAQLRSILDTVPDAMVTIDEHGTMESFSAAAERLFGYAADEVVGRNVSMLMAQADAARHDGHLTRYHATGERRIIGSSRRVLGRRKDGSIFSHELCVGEASGGGRRIFTGFLRDLTAREDAEARLREMQSELIHISRVSAIGTMATTLAHELNQPLTAIANYVQSSAALLSTNGNEQLELVREALEEAGREALRAGAIVQRLREFVARGELDRAIVSPLELATQACTLGAVGSRARGISCDVAISPDLRSVLVDRVQVQQVLLNLLRNAFEALGERGAVTVAARQDGGMIRVSVIDNGPGIAPGKEETLFEPFVSSKTSGMGLGLAISRTIIEAHGGRLWCESARDGGAAFHFTVPVAEPGDD